LRGIYRMDVMVGTNFFFGIKEVQSLSAYDRVTLANANMKLLVGFHTCWAYNKEDFPVYLEHLLKYGRREAHNEGNECVVEKLERLKNAQNRLQNDRRSIAFAFGNGEDMVKPYQ